MDDYGKHIILFDGVCNLCNGWVNFVIDRDPDARFVFAPLQSEVARELLKSERDPDRFDSIVLIEDDRVFEKSAAVLRIAGELESGWRLLSKLKIVPRSLRDALYDWFARNRYSWFGRRASCRVPTPDLQSRFLEPHRLSSTDT